jgi:flavin-dependent dehydrogenase
MNSHYDVAIVGGGPAGSTCAALLRRYNPRLSVAVLEREHFPREHVGESQLPVVSRILWEMGCWDKVEAAGFPIKIGATYRWGQTDELWDFEFIPTSQFRVEPRPAKFAGLRMQTAFQVDRAVYDKILLDHAASLGAQVFEGTKVQEVRSSDDSVEALVLADGREVTASHYVDASGHTGILRRALKVPVDEPTALQNIAIWDYWQNAEWAVSIGVGGTRVQVMSLGYGWIWFIPLGPSRTSVGLVVPASYYKKSGLKPEELYRQALSEEPLIASLLQNASAEGKLATTKDWSFVAERAAGKNWFLAGESLGFADPILAAGMTLAQNGARECAYTILSLEQGKLDRDWLTQQYEHNQIHHIRQHIRFADFWYTANGRFTDLKEYCSEIASDSGLDLDADRAFQWLGTGGFVNADMALPTISGFSGEATRVLEQHLRRKGARSPIEGNNLFDLNLEGAEKTLTAHYMQGSVQQVFAYKRGNRVLPVFGAYQPILEVLEHERTLHGFVSGLLEKFAKAFGPGDHTPKLSLAFQSLEALAVDGWVNCWLDPDLPGLELDTPAENWFLHRNRDNRKPSEVQK